MSDVAALEQPIAPLPEEGIGSGAVAGRSPWELAARRLLRNRVAMAALGLFVLIVLVSLAAPLYAEHIAHTDPFVPNLNGTTEVDGKQVPIMQQGGGALKLGVTPIGPTWHSNFFLGADNQGRDVMARVLYGGRSSLLIGIGSALICGLAAVIVGLLAGFFGGLTDTVLSRALDVIWAFPVYLLGISLSVVLLTSGGLQFGPVHVDSASRLLPILIIAVIYVPYVARPLRGQVLSLRGREFIVAGIGLGASDARILRKDVLPNVMPTVLVFLPLMTAINMLTESAFSFLSIGVQPPNASWGTIINDGLGLLYTRPMVTLAPGLLIAITAVALNLLGDSVRNALDPKARLRGAA
jgi:peptide/nickel transport system permease protein